MRLSKFHNIHKDDFPKVKPKGGPLNKGIQAAWRRAIKGEHYYGAGRATAFPDGADRATEKRPEDG